MAAVAAAAVTPTPTLTLAARVVQIQQPVEQEKEEEQTWLHGVARVPQQPLVAQALLPASAQVKTAGLDMAAPRFTTAPKAVAVVEAEAAFTVAVQA